MVEQRSSRQLTSQLMMMKIGSRKLVTPPSTVFLLWVSIWLVCGGTIPEEGEYACSSNKVKTGDPIAAAISGLASKLLYAGPALVTAPGRTFCYTNVAGGATAYGSAYCNLHTSPSCATCLGDALGALSVNCPDSVGAQITLTHCFMRLEAYRYEYDCL